MSFTTPTNSSFCERRVYQSPALIRFDEQYLFFRPMMKIIGRNLLGKVAWGVRMRVFVGGSLSMLDLLSDIVVVIIQLSRGGKERAFGYLTLATVMMCMGSQMLVVIYINRKKSAGRIFKEMLYVRASEASSNDEPAAAAHQRTSEASAKNELAAAVHHPIRPPLIVLARRRRRPLTSAHLATLPLTHLCGAGT